jgi:hypothetical protein
MGWAWWSEDEEFEEEELENVERILSAVDWLK